MMYNVFVAKQSIEIGYSNVGYIRKGSISVIQVKEMLVMARFTLPRDLYFGENALETLKTIKGNKAVLCLGGGSMKRFGFVDKVVEYLKEAGIETKLIEGIEPDPSVETVMKGAKVMQEFEPDLIIAMGGEDHQSMQQRQCGYFMNIQRQPLMISKIHLPFRHFVTKQPLSQFHQPQEQQQR